MRRRPALLALVLALLTSVGLTATPAHSVVGGNDAVTNPGSVSLWTASPNRNRCSGTLIDDDDTEGGEEEGSRWVLTAAHCVYVFLENGAAPVEARIGGTNNSTTGGNYISRTAVGFTWHPTFDPSTLVGDIMLVELNESVVAPALKYDFPNPGAGLVGDVYGWGWTCDGPAGLPCSSFYQGPLQQDPSHTLPDSACLTAVDPAHACFESLTPGASSCRGDSGAPYTARVFTGGRWQRMAPIMTLGDGDDFAGTSCLTAPDGSRGLSLGIKISPYRAWIQATIDASAAHSRAVLPPPTEYALSLIN